MANQKGGVLPRQAVRRLIELGHITADSPVPEASLQPASLDLRLGARAYRLRSSFLPGSRTVADKLREFQMGFVDLSRGGVLERERPYLIPIQERLDLPQAIRGRANPRSSTGRLDVFTRLLTDSGHHFDEVAAGYSGPMYLEVIPLSFAIKVRTGMTLNQLRFVTGAPRLTDDRLKATHDSDPLIYPGVSVDPGERAWVADGLFLTVDLSGRRSGVVGYKAKRSTALLDLDRKASYPVAAFWERVKADGEMLVLEPNDFYLLVSRERVRIPAHLAAEMAAYDPTSGELRTHYAGFFDPGFGVVPDRPAQGTHAVLEVRAHDVSFALEHGQRLCKLTFEDMLAEPDGLYGEASGSRYQRQYLALGRQFYVEKAATIDEPDDLLLFREPMVLGSDSEAGEEMRAPLSLDLRA